MSGAPIGRQPCDTTRADVRFRTDDDPDGPRGRHSTVEHEAVAARALRGRGHASDDGDVGTVGGERVEQVADRHAERVGEEEQRAVRCTVGEGRRGQPRVSVVEVVDGDGRQIDRHLVAPARREHRHRRGLFSLVRTREHRHCGRAEQRARSKQRAHRRGDVLEHAHVRRGHEHGHEVDGFVGLEPELIEQVADDLAGRVGRQRMLRQRRGEGHGTLASLRPEGEESGARSWSGPGRAGSARRPCRSR